MAYVDKDHLYFTTLVLNRRYIFLQIKKEADPKRSALPITIFSK